MQILYGDNRYTTPGLRIVDATSWEDVVAICETSRHCEMWREDKHSSGWLCNAILRDGARSRKLDDVTGMADWFGGDYDHANYSLGDIRTMFKGMACIAYTTASSTPADRHWRVLTPLSRECTTAEFTGIWRAFSLLSDGQLDEQCKNFNRIHYLPARWLDADAIHEFYTQDGRVWPVDELLEICPAQEPTYYTEVYEMTGKKRPDGSEIITSAMIERHMLAPHGGRFFKLLCAAAAMHKANSWTLDASELANAALQVSSRDSHGVSRAMSAYKEAEKAISYIDSSMKAQKPLERWVAQQRWKAGIRH